MIAITDYRFCIKRPISFYYLLINKLHEIKFTLPSVHNTAFKGNFYK